LFERLVTYDVSGIVLMIVAWWRMVNDTALS
jgi:hypothetical protein